MNLYNRLGFNKFSFFVKFFIGATFVLTIGFFIAMVIFGVMAINNPEAIGSFFGKIVSGFSNSSGIKF